jgi:tetratricopeptide (TPR) repeat protein/predicted aspartyl protease
MGVSRSTRTRLVAIFALCIAVAVPAPLWANCVLQKIAEVPIEMEGRRPTMTVQFNGHDGRLLLDSGAFYSMISTATAAQYNLKLSPAPFGFKVTGVGGAADTYLTSVKDFGLLGLTLHNVYFLVGGTEVGASGVMGQNLLEKFDDEYDLVHGAVRLFKTEGCGKTVLAYWASPGQSYSMLDIDRIDEKNPHTLADAALNGKPIRVMFDTGADTSVLSLRAAERAGVTPNSAGVIDGGYSFGIGRAGTKTYLARFESFKIGDNEEIKNIQLRIGALGIDGIDMLLGADFFLSHRIFISNREHKAFFTFNGGAVFNLSQGPATPAAPAAASGAPPAEAPAAGAAPQSAEGRGGEMPTDAAGFARRGEGFDARHDFLHALADLSKACELKPEEAEYFYRRALIYLHLNDPASALTDLNRVIKLKEDFLPAYLPRAEVYLGQGNVDAAEADLASLDRLAPKPADLRLELGDTYARLEHPAAAIAQFDLWIDSHPEDARLVSALSSRCMMRVQQNRDLERAADDCSKALRRVDRRDPNSSRLYVNRGVLRLRQGAYDKAIDDFNEALKRQPKTALAIYGRGVAESRKHQLDAAAADLAAARELDAKLAERYQRYGIAP